MKKVIVTGASSGIGEAIASALVSAGHEVYGIGRKYDKSSRLLENPLFYPHVCDLKRHTDVEKEIKLIKEEADEIGRAHV